MPRAFITTYRLRDGTRESLPLIDTSSAGAVIQLMDLFGDQLVTASAKPLKQ